MKFGFKKMITTVSALALCASSAMAEGGVSDVATAASAVAGDVATAAGTVVVAAFAIFGIIWGARKIKSALSGGA